MKSIHLLILSFVAFNFLWIFDLFSLPVDISFLVADVKYSEERGVQICEIQHGSDSVFKGEVFSNKGYSIITERFIEYFSAYTQPSWFIPSTISDRYLIKNLAKNSWTHVHDSKVLKKNKIFEEQCKLPVSDPYHITSYHGFVFTDSYSVKKLDHLGYGSSFILIDRAMLPYWRDKYKISLLFKDDPVLESCKPKWGLYQKKYTKQLSEDIFSELGAKCFVIKPRGHSCGNGVIITEKENLDRTLRYIFVKSQKLKNDPDRGYQSWYHDHSDTFLVEEFVPSDPVYVSHLGGKPYCPTIRIAFLAIYNQGVAEIYFLGGYHCLPERSLSSEGNFHQKYKTSLKTIHSSAIDREFYTFLTSELYEPLRKFYQKIIDAQSVDD